MLGGMDEWSWTITGQKESPAASGATTKDVAPTVVMGVRKKRKPNASVDLNGTSPSPDAAQTLGEGLVRKKTKVEPVSVNGAASANGVRTLSADLVRKKPKA